VQRDYVNLHDRQLVTSDSRAGLPARSWDYLSDVYTKSAPDYYPVVVWQFWGRAAEASWTEKFRTLFSFSGQGRWGATSEPYPPACFCDFR